MELERKTFEVDLKHADEGEATFIASVFGNVDADGDIVDRGAFRDTLRRRTPKFVADHRWEVSSKLGRVLRARETDEGLEVTVKFGLHNPLAQQVYEDFKFDPHQEFSFGFTVPQGGVEWVQGVRHIKKVDLFEVSNVLIGANPATRLVGVKDDEPEEHFEKAVDNSAWDGNAAMTAASNASNPASAFAAICAGRREGDPSERQTWALPHHKRPGAAPNAAGVRNARARFGQTEGLINRAAAGAHLERHMATIQEASDMDPETVEVKDPEATPDPEPIAPDFTEEQEALRLVDEDLYRHIVEQN